MIGRTPTRHMDVRYTIETTASGWSLTDGAEVLLTTRARSDALLVGVMLTAAAKAAGGSATLVVAGEDRAGAVEPAGL